MTHNDNSTFVYTINFTNAHPQPATPTLTANPNPATTGAQLTLSTTTTYASGHTFSWTLNNQEVGNTSTCTVVPNALGVNTYKLTVSKDGCSAENTIDVTVNLGVPTVQGGKTCGNGAVTLTAVPAAGATCRWYAAAQGGTPLATGNTYTTPELTSSATYYVSAYDANTNSESNRVPVTAQWYPAVPAPTNVTTSVSICGQGEVELSANPGNNTCHWYSTNTSTTVLSTASTYKPTVQGNTDYYVSAYNTSSGCESSPRVHVEVTVNEIPTAPTLKDSTNCGTLQITLTATGVPQGCTVNWFSDAQGTNSLPSETVTVSQSTNYYATNVNTSTGCSSSVSSMTITILGKPASPSSSPVAVCKGKTATLEATCATGNTCRWYNTSGSFLTTGSSYTTPALNANATYYVAAFNGTCESDRVSVAVTVNDNPVAPSLSNVEKCGPQQVTLTATPATGCTVQWYSDAQGANVLPSNSVQVNTTTTYYAANVDGQTGCSSSLSPMTITIKPVPAEPTLNGEYIYCLAPNTTTDVTLSATTDAGVGCRWYDANYGEKSTQNTYTLTNQGSSSTWYMASYLDGCYSDTVRVDVKINTKPAQPSVNDITVCAAGEITLPSTSDAAGYEIRWYENDSRIEPSATGTVVYNVTANATLMAKAYDAQTGCESDGKSVTVTIHPVVTAPTATTPVYACGGNATLTATPAVNTTLKWYDNSHMEISGFNGQVSGLNATTHYYVSAMQDDCESETVDITVIPSVIPSGLQISGNARLCQGENVEMTVTPAQGMGVRWYNTQDATVASGTENTYTLNAPAVGSYTYYAEQYDLTTGCASSRSSFALTVNTKPVAPTLSNKENCGPLQMMLTATPATGCTVQWFSDAQGANVLPSNSVQVNTTTTYYAANVDGQTNCRSNVVPMTITIKPVPAVPTVNGEYNYCLASNTNTNVQLSATPVTENSSCRWYDANYGGVSNNNNYTVNNVGSSTTYYVASYLDGCYSDTVEVQIKINTKPAQPSVDNITVCAAGEITLPSTSDAAGYEIRWYENNNRIEPSATGAVVYNVTANTTLTATSYDAQTGCESEGKSVTVTIHPVVTAPTATTPVYACGGNATLTATPAANTTLKWYDNSHAELSGFNGQVSGLSATTHYYVSAVQDDCESETVDITVIPSVIPSGLQISGNARLCQGENVEMTVTPDQGNGVRWYASETATTALSEQNTYTVNAPAVGNYTYYAEQYDLTTGCVSPRSSFAFTVNAAPSAPTLSNVTSCGTLQTTLTAEAATGCTVNWYSDAQGSNSLPSNSVQVNTTTTYYAANVDGQTNCRSNVASMTVTIKPVPANPTVNGEYNYCLASNTNTNVQLSATPVTENSSCRWYDANYGGVSNNNNYTVNNVGSSTTYYVASYLDGCYSDTVRVDIKINTKPSLPAVDNIMLCAAGEVLLTGTPGANGDEVRWYENNSRIEPNATGAVVYNVTANTTLTATTYNTQTGCESDGKSVTATIHPVVTAPTVTMQTVYACGGNATLTATPAANTTLKWYDNDQLELVGFNGEVSGLSTTTHYYVSALQDGCESGMVDITVIPSDIPSALQISGNARLCQGENVEMTVTPDQGNGVRWYASETATTALSEQNTYTVSTPAVGSYTYYAEQYDLTTGCVSPRSSFAFTVNAAPSAPTLSNMTSCGTLQTTLTAEAATGCTVNWYSDAEGTNSLPSNSVQVDATTTYYAANVNTQTGCRSTVVPMTVTIKPVPAVPTVNGTYNYCLASNATTNVLLSATPAPNANYCQWFDANKRPTYQQDYTLRNVSSSTTYYVASYLDGCYSDTVEVKIEINTKPGQPTADNIMLCAAGEVTLTGTPGANGDEVRWYVNNSRIEPSATGAVVYNATGNTTLTATTYNTQTGCESDGKSVALTIHPVVAAPTATTPVYACGGSATLSATPASGATLKWYDANHTEMAGFDGQVSGLTENTTYYVSSMQDGCESGTTSVTVIPSVIPSALQISGDASLCQGESAVLTVQPADGMTVRWYASETATTALSEQNTYTVNTPAVGSYTYYVDQYNATTGCVSPRTSFTFVVNANPDAPVLSDTTNCGTMQMTLTATPASGCIVKWYSDAQGNSELANTNVTVRSSTTYYAANVNEQTGCRSTISSMNITIYSFPHVPVIAPVGTICYGDSVTLTAQVDASTIRCQWRNRNTYYEGTTITTPALTTTTSFHAKAFNEHCSSGEISVILTVNPRPQAPSVTPTAVCEGENMVLTVNPGSDMEAHWYANAQATEVLATTDNLTLPNLNAGDSTFYVSFAYTQTGCESGRTAVQTTVYPSYPNVHIYETACDVYNWAGLSYPNSGLFERTFHTNHGCDSIVTLHLTINRSKQTTVDTVVCDRFVWNGETFTNSGVLTHVYEAANGCDSTVTVNLTVKKSTQATDRIYVCANAYPVEYNGSSFDHAGTYTVVIPNSVGCDSVITLTIVTNPQPTMMSVTDASRCAAGEVTLRAQGGTNGNQLNWYETGATQPFHHGNSLTTTVSATTTYYVSYYNTNTGCESERMPVTATVNENPALPTVSNQVRCGAGTVTFAATVGQNANTCQWFLTRNSTVVQATSLEYTANVTNASTSYFVESYNTATGCKSERAEVTAVVRPVPAVPVLTPMTNCGPASFVLPAPTEGYYTWHNSNIINDQTVQNTGTGYQMPTIDASTTVMVGHAVDYNDIICESATSELSFTIYPVYAPRILRDTICQDGQYVGYGIAETFNTPGSFERVVNTLSSNGCDSLVTLVLEVKDKKYNQISDEVCDQYVWNNQTYNTSGTYTQQFTAANGCDSIVTLSLVVNYSTANEFSIDTCDFYTWNNQTYTTTGNYVQHFNTVHGCDSVVTLHLTIHPSLTESFTEEACDSYTWNNETYTATGDYQQHFSTVHGCDSTVTLHLTIFHSSNVNYQDVVCAESRYQGYGFDTTIATADVYYLVHHNTNVDGCDSTTTLQLTVNPVYRKNISTTICETASFNFNGRILNVAGTYVDTLSTVNGCDSIITLNLAVASEYRDTIHADICQYDTYTLNGFQENTTGFYIQNLIASNNCDSVVVLDLTVHPLDTTYLTDEVCQNVAYNNYGFANVATDVAGTFTHERHVATRFGCDSTVFLTLTVKPVYELAFVDTICLGETYQLHGFDTLPTTVGTHTVVRRLQTTQGCDSVRVLTLTVNPTYNHDVYVSICQGDVYTYNNVEYTTTSVYPVMLTTINGCDSLVNLHLTVNPTYYYEATATTCDNAPYVWEGHANVTIPTTAGSYILWDSLRTVNGCDSIYELSLTVNPTYLIPMEDAVCSYELPYQWRGRAYEAAGVYFDSLKTAVGCDSVYQLTLTVNPAYYSEMTAVTCDNEPYVWDGHANVTIPTAAGQYVIWDSLKTAAGCDSVFKLALTVNPTYQEDLYEEICQGDVVSFNNNMYDEAGDYVAQLHSQNGCDSIVTLHLTVHPVYVRNIQIEACQGALPYVFNDTVQFTENSQRTVHLYTTHGCDSIINVTFNVIPFERHTDEVTICDNALPFQYQDSLFTEAGVYDVVQTFADGCNVITTLTLNVNPTYLHYDTVYACANKLPYIYNGNVALDEAGNDTLHYTTVNTCDSTVIVTLVVEPNPTTSDIQYVCPTELPLQYGDSLFATEGSYLVVFARENQCDSMVNLTIELNPTYFFESVETTCDNVPYVWEGHANITIPTAAGTYILWDSLKTVNNCDSIYKLTLTVNPTYYYEEDATTCDNVPYVWEGHANVTIPTAAGTYVIWDSLKTVNTCDSVYKLTLTVNPTFYYEAAASTCDNEPYVWEGHARVTIPTTAGTYEIWDSLKTVNTCDSVYKLTLTVNPTFYFEEAATTCDNVPYVWEGHANVTIPTAAGTYVIWDSLKTVNTCDSVYKLTLTVNPSYYDVMKAETCDNVPYVWEGHARVTIPTTAGMHIVWDSLKTQAGCDSVFQLYLMVNPAYYYENVGETCANEPYVWEGHANVTIPTTAGTHIVWDSLKTENYCDSVYKLMLTVHPTYYEETTAETCDNEPYAWIGHANVTIPTTAGTYEIWDSLKTVNHCDSVFKLTLTVFPTYSYDDTVYLCEYELPYPWHGADRTTSGIYYDRKLTANGCDSVYKLTLVVYPRFYNETSVTTCDNEPYVWEGHPNVTIPTTAGTYVIWDSLKTVNNCDSVYKLTLTVNPSYYDVMKAETCDNVPYVWEGHARVAIPTTAGTHILWDSLKTAAGCDSVFQLYLTVNPAYYYEEAATTCANEPYVWAGHANVTIPTTAGTHIVWDSLKTENYCDSVYKLTLTVHPTFFVEQMVNTCDNVPYVWNGHPNVTIPTVAGTYVIWDSLKTVNNCDSVFKLNLTVNPTFYHEETVTLCEYELPYPWHGENRTLAGDYYDRQQTVNGCDSVYKLTLIVFPRFYNETAVTTCDNEPYVWEGHPNVTIPTTAGTYVIWDSLKTVNNCDSVYKLTLTVNPSYYYENTATTCDNEPYVWAGHARVTIPTIAGTHILWDSLKTAAGCDSVYKLTLTVNPAYYYEEAATTCANEPYVWTGHANVTIPTAAGTHIVWDSLKTVNYCDSVYKLTLTVHPTFFVEQTVNTCDNVPYVWNGHPNVTIPTAAGTYVIWDSLKTVNYCDSVYKLNLTVNPTFYNEETVSLCEYELPYLWHGENRTQAGDYYDRQQTVNGCDSVYKLTLIVFPRFYNATAVTTCDNEPYVWEGHPNVTIPTTAGTYILWDSLQTVNHCDSVYKLTLTINPSYYQEETATTCDNVPYVWAGHPNVAMPTVAGTHIVWDSLQTLNFCDSVFKLTLTITPSFVTNIRDTICLGDSYQQFGFDTLPQTYGTVYAQQQLQTVSGCDSVVNLILTVNRTYLFVTDDNTCANTPYTWRGQTYSTSGTYYDNFTTVNGCDSVYVLNLTVNPTYEVEVEDSVIVYHNYTGYGMDVTPTEVGDQHYPIHLYTEDGCDSIINLTLHVLLNIGVEHYEQANISVYPNPTRNIVNIKGENLKRVYVYDGRGRLLRMEEADSDVFTSVQMGQYAAGYYVLRIQLADGQYVNRKIMVRP